MNHLRLILSISVLAATLMACSSAPKLDKETKINNALSAMETAAEAKSLDDFFEYVSDDFVSENYGWQKKDAKRILRIRLMRNSSVHVQQAVKNIEWLNEGDEQATVVVVAAMAGTEFSLSDLPSFRGDVLKFTVTFNLFDGDYLITAAQWQHARPADLMF